MADFFGYPTIVGQTQRELWQFGRHIGELDLRSQDWWEGDEILAIGEGFLYSFRALKQTLHKLIGHKRKSAGELSALEEEVKRIYSTVAGSYHEWTVGNRHAPCLGEIFIESLMDLVSGLERLLAKHEIEIEVGRAWLHAGLLSALAGSPQGRSETIDPEANWALPGLENVWEDLTRKQRILLRAIREHGKGSGWPVEEAWRHMNWSGPEPDKNLRTQLAEAKKRLGRQNTSVPWRRNKGCLVWCGR